MKSEAAFEVLKRHFPHTGKLTDKIACFASDSGREIALERKRATDIFVWVESYGGGIEGVTIRNIKNPGFPYASSQSRNSNLNGYTAPNLKKGNRVWYLAIDSIPTLEQFLDWYSRQ
jgi:hypothetical protein